MKTSRTVKVVLQDDEDNVLLLRRSPTHPSQASQMDLPGGFIDGSEEPLETLLREISEETGLNLASTKLKLVYAKTEEIDTDSRIRLVYAGRLPGIKPQINLSWEHGGYHWLPMKEAVKSLDPNKYKFQALTYLAENNILTEF